MGITSAVSEAPVEAESGAAGSRRFEAPANTDPAENAIQPKETAKKKIIVPCSSVMLAKRTTCSI